SRARAPRRPPALRARAPQSAAEPGRAPAGARFATMAGPFPRSNPDMIVLEGLPALSPFRRERLQTRLQAIDPGIRVTGAWHVYWLDADPAALADRAAMHRILQSSDEAAPVDAGSLSRYVSPRLGTLSPWASKAGELLRGAGLPVRRVERGTRIDIAGWPSDPAAASAVAD